MTLDDCLAFTFSESIWIIEKLAVADNFLAAVVAAADLKISNDLLHHPPFKMKRKIPRSPEDFCLQELGGSGGDTMR